jgi:hypothetical protein
MVAAPEKPGSPPSGWPAELRALAAVLAVLAAFFTPALLGGGQFLSLDTGALHHPVKAWLAGELRAGHLPTWNPYLGLGVPVLAGAVDGLLHPFTLLLALLPFEAAFRAWVLLSYALAAAGAFLWARRLGAGPPAAAVAALGFSLSGFLVSSSSNLTFLTAVAALPLLLAAAHAFVESPGPGRLAAVALAGFLAASAGDPQSFVLVVAALPLAALATVPGAGGPGRRALLGLAAASAAILGAAPVLAPVLAWVPHSSRGDPLDPVDLARFNLHPVRLLELALPSLFRGEPGAAWPEPYRAFIADPNTVRPWIASVHVGAATLALALLAAVRQRGAGWLVAAAALTLWMALGPHAGFAQVADGLPLLGRFRFWEKLTAFAPLLLSAAAAIGAETLSRERAGRGLVGWWAGLGLLLVAGAVAAWLGEARLVLALGAGGRLVAARLLAGNLREALLVTGLVLLALAAAAVLIGRARPGSRAPALLALVVAAELAGSSSQAWAPSSLESTGPGAPLPAWLSGQPGLQRVVSPPADPAPGRLELPGLTEAEANGRWYARKLEAASNVRWRVGNVRSYVGLVPARAMRWERRTAARPRLGTVGLFGVAQAVVTGAPEAAGAYGLEPPYQVVASDPELPAFLVALSHRPRAYLARRVEPVDRRAAMEFALREEATSGRTVLEGPVPDGLAPPRGSAAIASDRPERVEVAVEADRPALLVLNDVFAEGWKAEVDGRPARIWPANYLVRGVWVEPGVHRVVFSYRPPGLAAGLAAAAGLVVALAGWAAWRRRPVG